MFACVIRGYEPNRVIFKRESEASILITDHTFLVPLLLLTRSRKYLSIIIIKLTPIVIKLHPCDNNNENNNNNNNNRAQGDGKETFVFRTHLFQERACSQDVLAIIRANSGR